MRWGMLAALALGAAFPVLAWSMVQSGWESESRSLLGIYQHYLLFGIEPIGRNLAWLARDAPLGNVMYPGLVLLAGAWLMARGASPAALTLWLAAPFFAQWWIAYTPGQLPRYLWPCYVIAAMAWGGSMAACVRSDRRLAFRMVALLILVLPPALWLRVQVPELAGNREMRPVQEVAEYLRREYPEGGMATTDYVLRGALEFLTDKPVADAHAAGEPDLIVVRRDTLGGMNVATIEFTAGAYAVVRNAAE